MLKDALDKMPEDTPEKQARLAAMRAAEAEGNLPEGYARQRRWIGVLGYLGAKPAGSRDPRA
jgi:hypothetical protein